jgi:hypothetical protein
VIARTAILLAFVLALSPIGAGAQSPTPAPAPSPFRLTIDAATLSGLPRLTISATDEGGHTNTYRGVSLRDLLVRAGAPSGMPVRGKAMLSYVVVGAADGYHVLFTLPELDASYTDHVVLIAESRRRAAAGRRRTLPADRPVRETRCALGTARHGGRSRKRSRSLKGRHDANQRA